jgi:hypothetical protein
MLVSRGKGEKGADPMTGGGSSTPLGEEVCPLLSTLIS